MVSCSGAMVGLLGVILACLNPFLGVPAVCVVSLLLHCLQRKVLLNPLWKAFGSVRLALTVYKNEL